jgi:hypothetical protein
MGLMRKDLKDELMERLVDVMGPMRYSSILQVADVVDVVEEVIDRDIDRRMLADSEKRGGRTDAKL